MGRDPEEREDGNMNLAVIDALNALTDKIGEALSDGRKRGRRREEEDDAPDSVRELRRGRRDPLEIQGVMAQVSVPIGRRGETMPLYVLLPPVRDERELEDLALELERKFRNVKIFGPKFEGQGSGGGWRNGGGYDRGRGYGGDRGYYDRDRRW